MSAAVSTHLPAPVGGSFIYLAAISHRPRSTPLALRGGLAHAGDTSSHIRRPNSWGACAIVTIVGASRIWRRRPGDRVTDRGWRTVVRSSAEPREDVGGTPSNDGVAARNLDGLEAFLRVQRAKPPTADALGGPLTKYDDNVFDWLLIAVFRTVMSGTAKWQSPLPFWGPTAYDGMLEVSHAMQWKRSLQETEDVSMAVIDGLIPAEGKERFRTALKTNKFGTEINAWITAVFFPFMVGKCEVQERTKEDLPDVIPDGEVWKCAVKIEKCRWLERSGCVGMCAGLCKRPMQRMFGDVLGMPLSMEPNVEDLSCTMVFGKEPARWEEDTLKDTPCFSTCATARRDGTACHKLR